MFPAIKKNSGKTQMMTTEDSDIEEIKLDLDFLEEHRLVLLNDDHNNMYHIMACLTVICDMKACDAYSLTMRAHTNGSCTIKYGDPSVLQTECLLLHDHGVNSVVIK